MTEADRTSMIYVKRSLTKARNEISAVAGFMEARLTTDYNLAMSKEYGRVCYILGIIEEQITQISNQLTNIKK